MIRIMLVDDHVLVRTGIVRMLLDYPDLKVVAQAGSGEVAIKVVRETKPDIILMDIKMPGMGGMEATKKILHANPDAKIIALSGFEGGPVPTRILQTGALGYLTKGIEIEEMVKAIRVVHSGQRYITSLIATQLAVQSYQDPAASPFDNLSGRELQITIMLVSCQKVHDISEQLCLSAKTINSYRYRIFSKLGLSSDVELTLLAVQHGLADVLTSI